MTTSSFEALTNFRQQMYQLFMRRRDALFELTDALPTTGPLLSPAHLSLAAAFQRGWGSVYDALVDGQIEDQAIERLLSRHRQYQQKQETSSAWHAKGPGCSGEVL